MRNFMKQAFLVLATLLLSLSCTKIESWEDFLGKNERDIERNDDELNEKDKNNDSAVVPDEEADLSDEFLMELDEYPDEDFTDEEIQDDTQADEDFNFDDDHDDVFSTDEDDYTDEDIIEICSGNFPNLFKELCWSDKASNTMSWDDATSYCQNMGGRLPNIQELRMLIQNCPQTEYPKPDGQEEWCEIEDPDKLASGDSSDVCSLSCSGDLNVFGDTGFLWSSSVYVSWTGNAWGVNFHPTYVGSNNKTSTYYARCVRCIAE